MLHQPWTLEGNAARLNTPLSAEVDLAHPERGLRQATICGQSLPTDAEIFGLRMGEQAEFEGTAPAEAYVRNSDLVARYEEAPALGFRFELYWSFVEGTWGVGCDLLCSVQTSLLDCTPRMALRFRHPGSSLWQLHGEVQHCEGTETGAADACAAGLLLVPGVTARHALALAVYPSDFQGVLTRWSRQQEVELEIPLFGAWMEKGVIRRARVRLAFVDQATATAAARAAWHEFLAAPLPLTA